LHLYDFVRRDERMWLVLEHVDGWPLEELLQRDKALPPGAATAIALEVARALDHAHKRGVVHRDVQPRNVMISRRGQVKLVGFTIAVDDRLPSLPELLDGATNPAGPSYMSPEQILGEPADPRSDLFSLGVMLHEMLAGQRPFDAPDERSTTQRIRHDAATPLRRLVPAVPASLERVVQRCLEKLPTDRIQSAAELVQALAAVLSELGVVTPDRELVQVLRERGRPMQAPGKSEPAEPSSRLRAPPARLAPLITAMVAALAVALIGGALLQYLARREGGSQSRRTSARLELAPSRSGYLRVVADPWAHVVVDGQKVATTPFARPIPLRAGTHYVRLEHPNAATERRTVELAEGETVLLDVKLNVSIPPDAGAEYEFSSNTAARDAETDALPSP
jgi:serine/threonine-protein kinase